MHCQLAGRPLGCGNPCSKRRCLCYIGLKGRCHSCMQRQGAHSLAAHGHFQGEHSKQAKPIGKAVSYVFLDSRARQGKQHKYQTVVGPRGAHSLPACALHWVAAPYDILACIAAISLWWGVTNSSRPLCLTRPCGPVCRTQGGEGSCRPAWQAPRSCS